MCKCVSVICRLARVYDIQQAGELDKTHEALSLTHKHTNITHTKFFGFFVSNIVSTTTIAFTKCRSNSPPHTKRAATEEWGTHYKYWTPEHKTIYSLITNRSKHIVVFYTPLSYFKLINCVIPPTHKHNKAFHS